MSSPSQEDKGKLLQSWKEIAAFLGVTERSAQRWARTADLPVYRTPSGSKGRIFAYTGELVKWRENGGPGLAPAEESEVEITAAHAPAKSGTKRIVRSWRLAAGLLLALAGAGWVASRLIGSGRQRVPEDWVLERTLLRILDQDGRLIWQHRFPNLNHFYYHNIPGDKVLIADVDADGRREVLFFLTPEEPGRVGGSLLCFEQDGRLRWEHRLGAPRTFMGRSFAPTYTGRHIRVLKTKAGVHVLTVANHHMWFPAQVAGLDPVTGRVVWEYWHPGALHRCVLHDLDGDGYEEILLGGINNPGDGLGHAALAILKVPLRTVAGDPSDPFPPVTGGGEQAYALFPVPDACRIQGILPILSYLTVDPRGWIVAQTPVPDGGITYYLDRELNVKEFRLSDNFAPWHERLRRQGLLDHALSTPEIAALGKVMRFRAAPDGNHPALERFWAY